MFGFWLVLIGCLTPVTAPNGGDADTDSDSDSDSDADADTDADADADAAMLQAPSEFDFGAVGVGCEDIRQVVITNPGTVELQIANAFAGGAYTLQGPASFRIAPNADQVLDVRFAPVVEQIYQTPLRIESNAGTTDINLIGEGAALIGGQTWVQTENLVADVLVVVDNSCSMAEEQVLLQNNVATLLTTLDNIGADYQIGVITTDMDAPSQRGRFVGSMVTNNTPNRLSVLQAQLIQGTGGSFNERPLDAIGAALTPPQINGVNAGFLRTGAQVTAIVLTDEDDTSTITAAEFSTQFELVQGDPALTTLSGLAGPPFGLNPCMSGGIQGAPAPKLQEAAVGTGGGLFDLCAASDWGHHMRTLARVATGHQIAFPLSPTPSNPASIEVFIDGTPVPEDTADGWVYFQGTVFLGGSWVPDAGETVRITHSDAPFGCP